jgi:hypothetical protein
MNSRPRQIHNKRGSTQKSFDGLSDDCSENEAEQLSDGIADHNSQSADDSFSNSSSSGFNNSGGCNCPKNK